MPLSSAFSIQFEIFYPCPIQKNERESLALEVMIALAPLLSRQVLGLALLWRFYLLRSSSSSTILPRYVCSRMYVTLSFVYKNCNMWWWWRFCVCIGNRNYTHRCCRSEDTNAYTYYNLGALFASTQSPFTTLFLEKSTFKKEGFEEMLFTSSIVAYFTQLYVFDRCNDRW